MKMKKGLLLVVFLLAISSVMAAMSYSTAKVTSAMTGSITTSEESLLSLRLGKVDHNAAYMEEGVLKLKFDKGREGIKYGSQRNSQYMWEDLFQIKNNSENIVNATIKTVNPLPTGVKLSIRIEGSDWKELSNAATGVQFNNWAVASQKRVDIRIEVADGATTTMGDFKPDLIVEGAAVAKTRP